MECRRFVALHDEHPTGEYLRLAGNLGVVVLWLTGVSHRSDSLGDFLLFHSGGSSQCSSSSVFFLSQNYYRWTSREIKRIASVSLSPVYAHFGETIAGLSTIRAFRHVPRFVEHNFFLVTNSVRAQFASLVAGSWLSFRLQLIGIVMVASISLIGVFEHVYTIQGSNPSLVGLSLSYILSVTGLLNGLISSFTETEKEMVGVERVTAYIDDLPIEGDGDEAVAIVQESREQRGATVEYRHVTMKYNVEHKPALDNVTFQIGANEKIGIVGRTGSGKSSLLATLFRTVNLSDGHIFLDNVDTTTLNRQTLRYSIHLHSPLQKHLSMFSRQTLAIIPQDPFLFSGTIRENLDPYQHFSEVEIYRVLEKCDLRGLVENLGKTGRNSSASSGEFFVRQWTRFDDCRTGSELFGRPKTSENGMIKGHG